MNRTSDPDVSILAAHGNCGYPTGIARAQTRCSAAAAALDSGKPLWATELGAIDAEVQQGYAPRCAGTIDRVFTREYVDARVTGLLEWPAIGSRAQFADLSVRAATAGPGLDSDGGIRTGVTCLDPKASVPRPRTSHTGR